MDYIEYDFNIGRSRIFHILNLEKKSMDVFELRTTSPTEREFMEKVVAANLNLPKGYIGADLKIQGRVNE